LSEFLVALYTVFCLGCLSWSADSLVRTLKHTCLYLLSPSLPVISQMETWGTFGRNMSRMIRLDDKYRRNETKWERDKLDELRLAALADENQRLSALLGVSPFPDYSSRASRVLARDANDWFHSILIQKGLRHGVKLSDPVLTVQNERLALVGQVVELYERTCRVLLITDPLSAVSARLSRTGEEGAVEGQGMNRLVMHYLLSDSDVRVGDEVVSAGLGHVFPEGVLLGTVVSVEGGSDESFKRVYLKPAVRISRLQEVLLLSRRSEGK